MMSDVGFANHATCVLAEMLMLQTLLLSQIWKAHVLLVPGMQTSGLSVMYVSPELVNAATRHKFGCMSSSASHSKLTQFSMSIQSSQASCITVLAMLV